MGRRESPVESHLYRVSLDGGPIERLTREPGTHSVCVARAGDHFVDTHSRPTVPPRTTLCDRDGETLLFIDNAAEDPRLGKLTLVPPAPVRFRNREGTMLLGAYYEPRSRDLEVQGKVPLVVIVYGGPHVQIVTRSWAMTADLTAQYLTEQGFAVWKMDNRGSAHRGLAFESALHLRMGSVEVADQIDGVAHLAENYPEVDARRVGIMGGSYGGYLTLRALMEAPDVFHAGVASAPVTDWAGYDTCYTERYMGTPAENPEGYRESSVLAGVDRIRGPLLVVHGMLDENVHFRHSRAPGRGADRGREAVLVPAAPGGEALIAQRDRSEPTWPGGSPSSSGRHCHERRDRPGFGKSRQSSRAAASPVRRRVGADAPRVPALRLGAGR